jgi:hypothetical protein
MMFRIYKSRANFVVVGFGDFSSNPGESDMLMRNSSTASSTTSATTRSLTPSRWALSVRIGGLPPSAISAAMPMKPIWDARHQHRPVRALRPRQQQIMAAFSLGAVGLDWLVAGVGTLNGPGTSDLVLRNVNTGTFEVYDISNNMITSATNWARSGWISRSAASPPILRPVIQVRWPSSCRRWRVLAVVAAQPMD